MPKQLDLFGKEVELNNKIKTVISASRRTDMPAFYYSKLQEMLSCGFVRLPNPIFKSKSYTVDLKPESVHSMVLWSKNFINVLKDPKHLINYNLYFQYTINNYSKFLEPNVPEYDKTIHTLDRLLKTYIPEQFNIRFDPVIISKKGEISPTLNPEDARLNAFKRLCKDLTTLGMENCRVTTSYLAIYNNVGRKLKECGLDSKHLNEKQQISFFEKMSETAYKYNISLYCCASPILQKVKGIKKGRCIDGKLLEKLFNGRVTKSKDTGQRKACACTKSKDIGIYPDSPHGMKCLHGCKYCYVKGN